MEEFKTALGSEPSLLLNHVASVIQSILNIVNSGVLNMPGHVDWGQIADQAATLTLNK